MDPEPQPEEENNQEQAKSLNHNSLYYTYLQRYYTTYESENQYVHMHSNGLFLISVKKSALPGKPLEIRNILQPIEVKGKKKKGGVKVKPNTHIAHIVCEDQKILKVEAKVEGNVIEFNDNLSIENLGTDEGYLVIILPTKKFVASDVGMKQIFRK